MNLPTINENVTAKFTATLKDEDGAAIGSSSLTTLRATLYDVKTGTVSGTRNKQNILNVNGGSVSAEGVLSLLLDPADTALTNQYAVSPEDHVLLIEWTYNNGNKAGNHECHFFVQPMAHVPA